MRITTRLWQHACRITLFTHDACSLCHDAKRVLSSVQKQKPFQYSEKNIKLPENKQWNDIYAFDVPVIHVEKSESPEGVNPPMEQKLMHRFKDEQILDLLNKIERCTGLLELALPHVIGARGVILAPMLVTFSSCTRRAKMQAANRLREVLKSSKPAFGAWQMLPGHRVARGLASSGVDWVLADQEHGNIDDAAMHEAVSTIASCGVSPLVRIPDAQLWMVKRALDAGAHGIMVPLLRSAKQAEELVQLAKFPPVGVRGYGSPFSMNAFATGTQRVPTQVEYLQQANAALLTIVQIETKEALEDVEKIAAVPGIDVLYVGPFDLGNNIGHPIVSAEIPAELKTAIQRIKDAAASNGKYSGVYALNGKQAKAYADQGFNMVNVMTDAAVLPAYTSQQLADARGGEAEPTTGPYGR